MKVITEERLLEKFVALYWGTDNCDQLLEKLLAECKEIGTLEVSKLRPMSDLLKLKDYKTEVLATRNSETFVKIRQSADDEVYCYELGKYLPASQFIGFIPIPVYKPEEMIWPNACG